MSHHNFFLDYTVGTFVYHNKKCLLCHHRNMDMWLPVGGHIDENELPDKAAIREAKEEAGIEVKLIGASAGREYDSELCESLIAPLFIDRHFVKGAHWHCSLLYAAVPVDPEPKIVLDTSEHIALDWFTIDEIDKLKPMLPTMRYYAKYITQMMHQRDYTGYFRVVI